LLYDGGEAREDEEQTFDDETKADEL